MPDLMPALSPTPPSAPAPSIAGVAGGAVAPAMHAARSPSFHRTLGALLNAADVAPPIKANPGAAPASTDRQGLAADGKELPGDLPGDPLNDVPDDEVAADPIAQWLAPLPQPGTEQTSAASDDAPRTSDPIGTRADTAPAPVALAEALPPDDATPTPDDAVPAEASPRRYARPLPDAVLPFPLPVPLPPLVASTPPDVPSPANAAEIARAGDPRVAAVGPGAAPALAGLTPPSLPLPDLAPPGAPHADPTSLTPSQTQDHAAPDTLAAAPRDPVAPPVAQSDPDFQVSSIPQPARQVFAAAITLAAAWRDRATRRDGDGTAALVPTALGAAAEHASIPAAQSARDAAIDLRQDHGLQQMIDRIESLRDEADARDTRIRLVPDALGRVDIAVRRDGDAVQVHFTAERESTQTLLVDAQPRLTELAATRGIRIAEASVSSGTLSHGQGGGAAPQPRFTPVIDRPTPTDADATEDLTDQRLA